MLGGRAIPHFDRGHAHNPVGVSKIGHAHFEKKFEREGSLHHLTLKI